MHPSQAATKLVLVLLVAALAAGALGVGPSGGGPRAEAAGPPPNIVFIITDDQRWDSLQYMPNVQRHLTDEGVKFTRAYVSNALCCPSRATALTGNYSHTTDVWRNSPPHGGLRSFNESSTLATKLDPVYETALMGKYLNGYMDLTHVPPGWDEWFAFEGRDAKYYGFNASVDGVPRHFKRSPRNYVMRVLQRRAVNFIRGAEGPLFLFLTPPNPHRPSIPAPPDLDALPDWEPPRPPNYDEEDVSDKPAWVQALPSLADGDPERWDRLALDMTRSLLAIDRSVKKIVEALQDTGRLENTLIVFTSDNGISWGEHRWNFKEAAFEENIHVPLIVRYDSAIQTPHFDDNLMVNVDNPATIFEAAGLTTVTEGESYLSLLADPSAPWRDAFLMEHMVAKIQNDPTRLIPNFCGVHTEDSKYIEYVNGEREMYDLSEDPYELQNLAGDPSRSVMQAMLETELAGMCRPIPQS